VSAEILIAPRVEVDERLDEPDSDDLTGWFAIATDPFPCPAEGCPFVARYMTAAHLILLWPRDDDRDLLAQAVRCRQAGRRPRVVEYERSMGRAIPWDLWVNQGQRVHAYGSRPDGYPDRYERL
jgi:hypothetical protein